MSRATLAGALAVLAGAMACGGDGSDEPAPIANALNTLSHGGIARTYLLHVPPGYSRSRPAPLVMGLHGYTGSSSAFESQSGLSEKADREGFLVAYPDGLRYPWTSANPQAWNAGGPYEAWTRGTDDVGFIDQVLEQVRRHYAVDPARIYVTGHSNGAFMSYRLARELSCKIAAIAPHSGQMLDAPASTPPCPVSVSHLHALDDPSAAYAGRTSDDPNAIQHPPVETALARWAALFGCRTTPDVTEAADDYTVLVWRCSGDSPRIELVRTNRGGHQWFRPDNSGVSAADLIWEFFRAHRAPPWRARSEAHAAFLASGVEARAIDALGAPRSTSSNGASASTRAASARRPSRI